MTIAETPGPEHNRQPFTLEDQTFDALLSLYDSRDPAEGSSFDTAHYLYETLMLAPAPTGLRSQYILHGPGTDTAVLMRVTIEHKLPTEILRGTLRHYDIVESHSEIRVLEKRFVDNDARGVPIPTYVGDAHDEVLRAIIEDARSGRQATSFRAKS